jgi:hypothetical protein
MSSDGEREHGNREDMHADGPEEVVPRVLIFFDYA